MLRVIPPTENLSCNRSDQVVNRFEHGYAKQVVRFFCYLLFPTLSALRAAKPQRLNSGCDFPLEVAKSRFRFQLLMCNNKSSDQSTFYYNFTQKSNLVKEQVMKEKTRTNMEMTPLLQDDLGVIGEDHALASQDLPNVRRECRYYYVS